MAEREGAARIAEASPIVFDRFLESWRRHGIGRTAGRAAYSVIGKVLCLDITRAYWIDLTEARPVDGRRGADDIRVRLLSPGEVDELTTADTASLADEFRQRARSGRDYCVAALRNSEVLGYAWYAVDSVEPEHNRGTAPASGVAVSLPQGVAFLYNVFVRPECRGQGVLGHLLNRSPAILEPLGIAKILGTTDWTNDAVRASVRKAGFVELGTIVRVALGPFGITRVSSNIPRVSGASFGKKVRVTNRSHLVTGLDGESAPTA